MFYQLYELSHAAMSPWRVAADAMRLAHANPLNPMARTPAGRAFAAGLEVFERTTRRYAKPEFGLKETTIGGEKVKVHEDIVWKKPFCNLINFDRAVKPSRRPDPKVLIVAPMSGHYAHTASRNGRDPSAERGCLYYRLDRCPHGARQQGLLRPG